MQTKIACVLGVMLSIASMGCAASDEGAEEPVGDTAQEVHAIRFVIFPQADRLPNPAANVRGFVTGYVGHNEQGISGLTGWTVTSMNLHGLPSNQTFGAHAHVLPCEDTQGGGHYQNIPGSTDPRTSEIWLDVHTNAYGEGQVGVVSPFAVRPGGVRSIVIHANATDANGKAGAKLACANLPLK
jgi:hypothetical protein